MKKFQALFVSVIILLVIVSFPWLWVQTRYAVPIMMYHSVNEIPRGAGMSLTPGNFRLQMDFLKRHHFNVITLDELVEAIKTKKWLPRNSVIITFDDGYEDNYTEAFPILRHYGFPATIFLITSVVGDKDYLTWDQVREMEKYGISFGSHTLEHVYLPGIPEERQRRQIFGSKKILEEKLGHPVGYIAYPSGGFTDAIKNFVKQAGYQGACTTNRGYASLNKDEYELKRIRFSNQDYYFSLLTKLSGFYNSFRSPRDPG